MESRTSAEKFVMAESDSSGWGLESSGSFHIHKSGACDRMTQRLGSAESINQSTYIWSLCVA